MFKNPNQIEDFFGLKSEEENGPKNSSLKNTIKENGNKKLKLRLLSKILSKRERYLILVFVLTILGSLISIPFSTYSHFTTEVADYGGVFKEGIVGEPGHINPILSRANDPDRDLVNLIYSSLLKYNEEGKLIPDLAKSYEISSDGLNYTIYLRDNAKWHNGETVTADDVIFTIGAAQNSDYNSPQRINWQGVEVERVDDLTLIFKLKNKYAQFLNNLTIGILPQHIWENIKPINFALSEFNLKPVGSGPYQFAKLKKNALGKVTSYELKSNRSFYLGRPFIDAIEIFFYDSEDLMIDAYNKNEIQSLAFISPQNLNKIKFKQRLNIREVKLPRYFGVFFNDEENDILAEKNVRLALNHATDKNALIEKIIGAKGTPVYSPLINGVIESLSQMTKYAYDENLAREILTNSNWGSPDENGVLTKNNEKLSIAITTSSWPELNEVAKLIKEQWEKIGAEVNVEILPTPQLQQVIKDRSYEALLFGEILNLDPDPFSLWHSSQKRDPGLNLALYDNSTADSLLEEARQTLNPLERLKKYDDFQKVVVEDAPAVFLYNPFYLYGQTKSIQGFESKVISMPSDRFSNVEKWFIETKRVWD